MENTNNILPKLNIKRRLEEIIADEWDHELVDQFTTSVSDNPQVWIVQCDDSFTPISNVNNKTLLSTCTVTVLVFSQTRETEVHQIINKLMNLAPRNFNGLKINSIAPISQSTNYQNDASQGHVMADVTLELKYFFERTS
ncbi:hypothetical protein NGC32_06315 [Kluyvera cryocrescens]|uniref:hypothetical protein n=1 Tax=Kluyvera cryocrescens TaxID=580 RepID=UPI002DB6F2F5|nr:hypothetical protein [Kluyvera cryocrescens]MEB7712339.1 hypothetical protein [Kluyvera cryocrescens]